MAMESLMVIFFDLTISYYQTERCAKDVILPKLESYRRDV